MDIYAVGSDDPVSGFKGGGVVGARDEGTEPADSIGGEEVRKKQSDGAGLLGDTKHAVPSTGMSVRWMADRLW